MSGLVRSLIRPYRAWVLIVFAAMMVETLMSLAAPWPLKVVLDNALGHDKLPEWLEWVHDLGIDRDTMGLALFAALATIVIAVLDSIADYIDNYYTESVGQWVAHDLRIRIYDHLHRLSLGYYATHQTGSLLSTLTSDVSTVQDFASSATLSIVVDMHDDRRHAGHHVLAQLGLRADRRRRDAVPAAVRDALQEGGEGRDARRAQAAERDRRGGAAGAGLRALGERVRPPGPRGQAHGRGEPRDGDGGAEGAAREVAARRRWSRSSSRCARRSCCGAAPR